MDMDSEAPAATAAVAAAADVMEEDERKFQVGDPQKRKLMKNAFIDQSAIVPVAKGIHIVDPMGCVIGTSADTKGPKGSQSHDLCEPALRAMPGSIQVVHKANPLFPISTCKPALGCSPPVNEKIMHMPAVTDTSPRWVPGHPPQFPTSLNWTPRSRLKADSDSREYHLTSGTDRWEQDVRGPMESDAVTHCHWGVNQKG